MPTVLPFFYGLFFLLGDGRAHARTKKWRALLQLIEGTGFSFACSDGTGNVSGMDATKLVALVIKDALLNLQQQEEAAPTARRGGGREIGSVIRRRLHRFDPPPRRR